MINGYRCTLRWILSAMVLGALGLSTQTFALQDPQAPAQQETQTPSQPEVQSPAQPQIQTPAETTPETPAKPDDTSKTQQPPAAKNPNKPANDRLFGVMPNYLTVEGASSLPPLTTGQKFKLQALGVFDPVEFTYIGIAAGLNQASNSEPQYGQGFIGYAKRYGTSFADTMIGNFGTGAIFPSLLHQDPRYYQLGKGAFGHRVKYAGLRVLITRSDSGKTEFNYSEFLGNGMAAAVANTYHPGEKTVGNSLSIMFTQIGWDALAYEMKEFWPDMHRLISKKKQQQ
jgi:hypothetical protein